MTSTPFALATLLFAASLTAAAAQNSAAPPHHHHKHHATAAQAKPAAAAQNAAAHSHHHRKHHTPAAKAKPAAALPTSSVSKQALAPLLAPPAAPSPALAPATSLVVAYKDGALAITSQSATLSEIFGRIHECTGAVIEAPALDESVSVQLGPEPPADVIAALLEGLPLNYAILGGASDQQRIERIIVTSIPPPGSPPAP